jgi:hypothetical protein
MTATLQRTCDSRLFAGMNPLPAASGAVGRQAEEDVRSVDPRGPLVPRLDEVGHVAPRPASTYWHGGLVVVELNPHVVVEEEPRYGSSALPTHWSGNGHCGAADSNTSFFFPFPLPPKNKRGNSGRVECNCSFTR